MILSQLAFLFHSGQQIPFLYYFTFPSALPAVSKRLLILLALRSIGSPLLIVWPILVLHPGLSGFFAQRKTWELEFSKKQEFIGSPALFFGSGVGVGDEIIFFLSLYFYFLFCFLINSFIGFTFFSCLWFFTNIVYRVFRSYVDSFLGYVNLNSDVALRPEFREQSFVGGLSPWFVSFLNLRFFTKS